MIKKRIRTIFIIIAILLIVFGVAFALMRYSNNPTYRHVLLVLISIPDNLTHLHEIRITKNFLKSTITLDNPSQEWLSQCKSPNPIRIFFIFKVWFTKAGVTPGMIDWGYLEFPVSRLDNDIFIDLKYGWNLPSIECRITETNGRSLIMAGFPLNNCLFYPDYNDDGVVDMKDVILAKNKRLATH